MSRFAPKTLRRMPATSREIARLSNELASVQTRLSNRIERLVSMEMMSRASERVFCSNAAHAEVVDAALGYFRAVDNPEAHAGEAVDTLARLRRSVEPLDPDRLFYKPDAQGIGDFKAS